MANNKQIKIHRSERLTVDDLYERERREELKASRKKIRKPTKNKRKIVVIKASKYLNDFIK